MALALVRTKDEIPGSIPGQDYLVFSGELRLGRIHKVAMTGGRERWHWNLFALVGPSDRIAHDGYTDTLKQAKAESPPASARFSRSPIGMSSSRCAGSQTCRQAPARQSDPAN